MAFFVVLLLAGFTEPGVYAQNTNPSFTSTPITTVNDDARYLYVISTFDINEDDVTVTATTIPSWLTLSNEPLVSTFAGSGSLGSADGTGDLAQFEFPYGVAVDGVGNVYVADTGNSKIRKISPDGVVITLAGSGTFGDDNGIGTEAQFGSPEGIAVDGIGNVYVADKYFHNIRKISLDGVVTTLAGVWYNIYAGDSQSRDGAGTIATFNEPKGLAVDGAGNVYVADSGNNRVRKISPSGIVSTLAGSGFGFVDGTGTAAQFRIPTGVAVDGSGNVFVADSNNGSVRKISSAGVVTTVNASYINFPTKVAIDNAGNILVTSPNGNRVEKINPSGVVSTLAGSLGGHLRDVDGAASEAKFSKPTGVAVDRAGNVFVADQYNHKIRKIEFPEYLLYGDASDQEAGNQIVKLTANDGQGGTATQNFTINVVDVTEPYFNSITGLPANFVENGTGRAYYVSTYDANDVTTSLGTSNDEALFNISGENVTFKTLPDFEDPKDGNKDNVYVIEIKANDGVFEITETVTITVTDYDDEAPVLSSATAVSFAENGTGIAYTIAATDLDSDASAATYSLGTANDEALFSIANNQISFKLAPDYEMASDGGTDNTYVISVIATDETGNSSNQDVTITVTNLNDNDPVFTSSPVTAVNDNASYSYIVTTNDPDGDKVTVSAPTLPGWLSLEHSTSNVVSTLAGVGSGYADGIGTALFAFPNSIAVNAQGYIYVAEEKRVRKVSPDGTVSTLAGNGTTGSVDGTGTAAMFESPGGVTVDATGNLYVIDKNKVRKITPGGVVTTFAVSEYSYLTNIAIDGSGNLYVSVIDDNKVLKLSPSGVFTTFAGSTEGFADGTGTQAQFQYPAGLATDALGNVYVADQGNDRIRKITPDGVVSTFAGSSTRGHLDGTGTAAFFSGPLDIAFDVNGNLYVADQYTALLRMISPDAVVSTLAGGGSGDGTGTAADFLNVYGITVDAVGNLYAADLDNHSIRKLAGELKLKGDATGQILTPQNVVLTASDGDDRTATQSFTITVDDATDPVFTSPTSVSFVENTTVTAYTIVATDANTITYSLGTNQDESLFDIAAGVVTFRVSPDFETPGDADGNNTYLIEVKANDGTNEVSQTVTITLSNVNETIQFTSTPVTQINDNLLYKYLITTNDMDGDDAMITATSLPSWLTLGTGTAETENFVGSPGQRGSVDGIGSAARFDSPNGIAIDAADNFYVSDWGNNRISKVSPNGLVSVFAGNGSAATADGTGTNASFNRPGALEFDSQGNLYVAEYDGHAIRKITPAGVVSTFAGSGSPGSANGTGTTASFIHPGGIAIDANDNLFVADAANHLIRKITPIGVVSTFAGSGIVSNVLGYGDGTFADGTGTDASFNFPSGIAIDSQGNLYVADAGNLVIRKITPGAVVTNHIGADIFTLFDGNISPSGDFSGGTGTDAFFLGTPVDVALDQNDNLFIIERDGLFGFNNALLKADVNGVLETVAGRVGFGTDDGTGTNAQFDGPSGLVINGSGNIYITESNSNRIRKVTFEKVLEGNPTGQVGTHNVMLNASDGNGSADTQSFTITVKDGSILTFSSAKTVNFDENSTAPAYIATTINKIPDAVTAYSLGTGSDNLLFEIAPTTGEVTFKTVPDFENPTDSDLDGTHAITVHATDGDNVVFQEVTITVNNVNEVLNFTSTPITSVDEDKPYSYTITASDEDGDFITIAAPGLPNWLSLTSESTGIVTTIAGNGSVGSINRKGTLAQFEEPTAIAVDIMGNIYVADNNNRSVRKIAPSGIVTTLAGNGKYGFADGTGTGAQFKNLEGIALDNAGNIYVVDNNDHRIRKITPSGVATTFAGSGNRASTDGTGTSAEFYNPSDIAIDNSGNLYISETRKIRKITPAGVVSTVAGNANSGSIDGTGTSAEFDNPHGLAIDAAGNIFVADRSNDNIRKITPEGVVSTLAGSGSSGLVDGTGTAAEFDGPRGLTIDDKGNLYVADFWNNSIRKVTPEGVVSTLAGDETEGFVDGTGSSARFDRPTGIAIDIAGNLYVADRDNHSIRKLQGKQLLVGDPIGQSSSQSVTLNATDGNGGADMQSFIITVNDAFAPVFTSPLATDFVENGTGAAYTALATDANAVTYSIDAGEDGGKFNIIGSTGVVTFMSAPDFENPTDIGADNTYEIRLIARDVANRTSVQTVTITVTNENDINPVFTSQPGITVNDNATYSYTISTFDGDGDPVSVSATKIPEWLSLAAGNAEVSTLAGSTTSGSDNGYGTSAGFNTPGGVVADAAGNLYVADFGNNTIRKIALSGEVTTFAGSGSASSVNGSGTEASFNGPQDVAIDGAGNIYVAERSGNNIRKIDASGNVSTLAGSGTGGSANGSGTEASFNSPEALTVDAAGNVYVADVNNYSVRKIDVAGNVSTYAGTGGWGTANGTGTSAGFSGPFGIAVDATGNLYVSDGGNTIRKIDLSQAVTTHAGSGSTGAQDGTGTEASFNHPNGIAIDASGNLYIADYSNHNIRKIDPFGVVTTLAGSGTSGTSNGTSAQFNQPSGVAVDAVGNVYVADKENHSIRKIAVAQMFLTGDATGQTAGAHTVSLTASDGAGGEGVQAFDITVVDVTDPVLTSLAYASFAENESTIAYIPIATDANPIDYSLGTGNDEGHFDLGRSGVSFKNAPNYENPTDIGADNTYVINVIATDNAGNTSNIDVTITVTDVNEAPVFTTATSTNFRENGTDFVFNPWALDPDANTRLAYSLGVDNDEAQFSIIEGIGLLSFKVSPDFENPTDTDGQNDYVLEVKVTDGVNIVSQILTVTVLNVEDTDPVFTSIKAVSFAENGTGAAYTIIATDDNTITYRLGTGNDEALFDIAGGAVTFKTAPDFEQPGGNNADNTYVINVIASDGINSVNQDVTITVTDVQEDVTAPAKPIITSITDDTGSSNNDGVTNDANIIINGTAEALSSVEVFTQYGTVRATQTNANGEWSLDITDISLLELKFNLTAKATDQAGNTSAASDVFVLKPDYTAPAKPVITDITDDTGSSNSDGVTNDANIIISGTAEALSSVEVFTQYGSVRTTQTNANGDWSLDITDISLLELKFNLTAKATDLAGNSSAASDVFVLTPDYTAPAKPLITSITDDTGSSNSDGITNDANIIISGTAEALSSVEVFTQYGTVQTTEADANGDWSLDITDISLVELSFNLTAKATDLAGNISETSDVFVLKPDYTAPAKPLITSVTDDTGSSNSDGITNDANIIISGTAEALSSVEVFTQYGTVRTTEADANGEWSLDITDISLVELSFNLTAKATDLAGNSSAASDLFVLTPDYTAPAKPLITSITDDTGSSNRDGITNDANIIISGTAEASSSVEVFTQYGSVRTTEVDANGNWSLDITDITLVELSFNLTAKATDLAGNASTTSDAFVLIADYTDPTVVLTAPSAPTASGFVVTAQFSEDVSDFTLSDITVATGTASNLQTVNANTFTFTVTSGNAAADVSIAGSLAEDLAGNPNTVSKTLNLDFTIPPAIGALQNPLVEFVKSEEINLYPNPVSSVLTIDLSEISAKEVDIYLYNAAGIPVFTKEAYKAKTLKLDVSSYTSGLYIVQFYDGQQVIRKKIMVRK